MGTFRGSVRRPQHAVCGVGEKVTCRRRWHMTRLAVLHTNGRTMVSCRSSISVAYAHSYTDDALQTRAVFLWQLWLAHFFVDDGSFVDDCGSCVVYVACGTTMRDALAANPHRCTDGAHQEHANRGGP